MLDTCHVLFFSSDKFHHIPMADMGNYQEYLKRMPTPLREADPAPARLHTFGNPFKLASDKDKVCFREGMVKWLFKGLQINSWMVNENFIK